MKKMLVSSIAFTGLTLLSAWLAWQANAATRNVTVGDNFFSDAVSGNSTTTIAVGDTVQWNWSGANPHTVTSTGAETFDSGGPQTSGTFSHTFNAVGSFSYVCGVHGTAMAGTIVVEAAQAPTNTPQATNTTAAATNTPSGSASATPPGAATNTPQGGGAAVTSTPASGTPAASGTQAGGGALPSAGTGSENGSSGWAMIAAAAAIAGFAIAGAAAYRLFRRPDM